MLFEITHTVQFGWSLDCRLHGHVFLWNSDGFLCKHCGQFWKVEEDG